MTPIRVLIVDDDPLVRAGLAMILGGATDLDLVGQAVDGRDALRLARETLAQVVLMDIRMPRLDGLEATAALCAWPDPPRVIVLTTFDADDHVARALVAGASGFLLKDTPPPDIVDAIRRVADGDPMLSPTVTVRLIAQLTTGAAPDRARSARDRLSRLTGREYEVARLVGRGLSNADIAAEIHLSVPTVKAHVGRVLSKLDAANRVQVALCVHDAALD